MPWPLCRPTADKMSSYLSGAEGIDAEALCNTSRALGLMKVQVTGTQNRDRFARSRSSAPPPRLL